MSESDDLSLLRLTGVSLHSVATVAAISGVGAFAKHRGILTKDVQKALGTLVSHLFLPALIVEKLIPNMDLELMQEVWPLAVLCVCTVAWGLASGFFLGKVLRLSDAMRGVLMVAVGFPNSFSCLNHNCCFFVFFNIRISDFRFFGFLYFRISEFHFPFFLS